MIKFLIPVTFLVLMLSTQAQYTEPWSDAIQLTDSESYNSNPLLVVFETSAYMLYEKKFSEDGQTSIYFKDLKNNGEETELLGNADFSYRNPRYSMDYQPNSSNYLFYESNEAGDFNIYVVPFDEFMVIGNPVQLTFTDSDENNTEFNNTWYSYLAWDNSGNVITAELEVQSDTMYLENIQIVDEDGCSKPEFCNSRMVYQKHSVDSTVVYFSDWEYSSSQWGEPEAIGPASDNSYCHCSNLGSFYFMEECIVYENEGYINNYYYDEIYELILPEFSEDMHAPHSILYDLPVDNFPAPLILTFLSGAYGDEDIYVHWTMDWGIDPENLSDDPLPNSNPRLMWGWYAPEPCAMYLLNIWETQLNGYQPLFMSKCALYVCGGVDVEIEAAHNLKIHPNPFTDKAIISYNSCSSEPVYIEVLNASGQLFFKKNVKVDGAGWFDFNFSPPGGIPKGILYIRLTQGRKQLFRKVIYK